MKINNNKNKSAIDLYSGIGGWSLGFKLAGIDISASYEWWEPANKTHQSNLESETHQVDIRKFPLMTYQKRSTSSLAVHLAPNFPILIEADQATSPMVWSILKNFLMLLINSNPLVGQ